MLVNARQVKNVPGRKTDVNDATWLAQLGPHGLVRGSFIPPEPVRQLRDLTRTRTALTRERTREWQRLEKLLEDAGIKLTSVATDVSGVSGRAMLDALIAGQRDPAVLADLARARLRDKVPALTETLTGRFRAPRVPGRVLAGGQAADVIDHDQVAAADPGHNFGDRGVDAGPADGGGQRLQAYATGGHGVDGGRDGLVVGSMRTPVIRPGTPLSWSSHLFELGGSGHAGGHVGGHIIATQPLVATSPASRHTACDLRGCV